MADTTHSMVSGLGMRLVTPSAPVWVIMLSSLRDCSQPDPVAAFSKSKRFVSAESTKQDQHEETIT